MHAAVDSREMHAQRGRDAVDKLVVCVFMTVESRFQRIAKVKHDRIIGRYARRWGQLDYPVGP
jgi:hypothetical protein